MPENSGNDPDRELMDAALAMLGRRRYSTPRLRQRLREKFRGADAADPEPVLARLTELRLLDDADYIAAFARDRTRRSRYGRLKIQSMLLAEGLAQSLIAQVLREALDGETENDSAQAALDKFVRRSAKEGRALREAAYRHLRSRGFTDEAVRELLRVL